LRAGLGAKSQHGYSSHGILSGHDLAPIGVSSEGQDVRNEMGIGKVDS